MKTLDIITKVSSIIASGSILVAIISYFYNKNRNKVLTVVDQISFFREKILVEGNKLITLVREKDKDYIFSLVKLDSPTIKAINEEQLVEVTKQIDLIKNYNTYSLQVNILNLLEELSLRIIFSKTINHKALYSIMPIFIQSVEMNGLVLMQEREITTGNKIFSGTLELYKTWKDKVDRTTPEQRFQKIIETYKKIIC